MHLAALIYRGMLYKLKEHFYYTKHKLFETPGFRRIISQNKMQNFYILLIMRSSLFLTTKSPKFSQYWKNSWYVSNYYVSWRAIYPLMSPFSCGRNALVENNTFLKRDQFRIERICFVRRIYRLCLERYLVRTWWSYAQWKHWFRLPCNQGINHTNGR